MELTIESKKYNYYDFSCVPLIINNFAQPVQYPKHSYIRAFENIQETSKINIFEPSDQGKKSVSKEQEPNRNEPSDHDQGKKSTPKMSTTKLLQIFEKFSGK